MRATGAGTDPAHRWILASFSSILATACRSIPRKPESIRPTGIDPTSCSIEAPLPRSPHRRSRRAGGTPRRGPAVRRGPPWPRRSWTAGRSGPGAPPASSRPARPSTPGPGVRSPRRAVRSVWVRGRYGRIPRASVVPGCAPRPEARSRSGRPRGPGVRWQGCQRMPGWLSDGGSGGPGFCTMPR